MDSATEFGLLGPLLVRRGEVMLPVAPGKQRAVLAVLLLDAGPGRSRWKCWSTRVWGEDPPRSVRNVVVPYGYVGLCKALDHRRAPGSGGHAVAPGRFGYLLAGQGVEQVDVHRFARGLAAEGGRCGRGRRAGAGVLLGEALALWRGAPLADVPSVAAGGAWSAAWPSRGCRR